MRWILMMRHSTIEQELEEQGRALIQTVGVSMEPLLHNRKSTVVIERAPEKLRKYDTVLYKRPGGEYVLHRVIKVREKDYLICGDNGLEREPVPRERIIGIMTGFYPDTDDLFVSIGDKKYRKYVRTWGRCYVIRWMKALPGRIHRKLIR